ncbi:putative fimbrial chaperone YadV [Cupriavidus laharis]|uniref:Fimbrial chaperone YadV n=2 Tax=Cupriavidus laharis TaxID=151654 RepID=A0ABM8X5D5_9BURK|nr:putative fimbrial chaperone YadV [Cupriavidus laharis]
MTLALIPHAYASVVIAGTRVIVNAEDREATIKLSNEGKSPALTQAWLDTGDAAAPPAGIDVPFTVTPPIARIDPGKAQTLRIHYTGEPLSADKESVFWLSVLEIPPKPTAEEMDANKLQLAFRSRIKLFFRPAGLQGDAGEAPARIAWRIVKSDHGLALEASNPTAYHVSFSSMELLDGAHSATNEAGGMVAPGKTTTFPLAGKVDPGKATTIRYQAINDHGGPIDGKASPGLPAITR